jgi:type IV secretion system protein VirD4
MVSGHPPVRAAKLRYFEDENFTARVLPPPSMPLPSSPEAAYPDRPAHRPDDWTGRPLPPAPVLSARRETDDVPDLQAPPPEGGGGISRVSELEQLLTQQNLTLHRLEVEDSANEPRLSEFDDEGDEPDPTSPLEPHARGRSDPALTRAARLAALDPDDRVPL